MENIDIKSETDVIEQKQNVLKSEFQKIATKNNRIDFRDEIPGDSVFKQDVRPVDMTKVDWNNLSFEDFAAIERRLFRNGQFLKETKIEEEKIKLKAKKLKEKKSEKLKDVEYKTIIMGNSIYELPLKFYNKYLEITDDEKQLRFLSKYSKLKNTIMSL
jgi:hypothetical protein